jgi:hypothetical protein
MPQWPDAIRQRAVEIYADEGGRLTVTQKRVKAELSADVPLSTLKNWIKGWRPVDDEPTVQGTAQRLIRLCSSEMRRLERLPTAKVDLDRAAKVAQILKTVEPLAKQKTGQGPRTLGDLDEGLTDAQNGTS